MKKRINWMVFSWIIMSIGFLGPISAEVIDRIVAIVDDDIITLVELERESAPYKQKIASSGYSDEKKQEAVSDLNKKIINALIDKSLTQQEAKRYQIVVSETELDNAVKRVMASKSLNQEQLDLALAREGMTMEAYRENIREQILQSKIIDHAVKSKVVVSESDIKLFYQESSEKYSGKKEYHLRNILVSSEDQANQIKKQLDAKKDFSTLAKESSIASNASGGGDLGQFDISNFSENIKESISKLNKGDHTDVISTAQGFQIFYIQDIVIEGGKTYEQARDEIHTILYREQVEAQFKTWLESLKKKAHIKIML